MNNIYLAIDADNAGRMVGRAVLANNVDELAAASARIELGQQIILDWVESHGGKKISAGGDECTAEVPADAINNIEQLRADYQFTTQLTITVGAGQSLSEAGKSLMAGKFRGKDQFVIYDPSVDEDVSKAKLNVFEGNGSEEENKLTTAYLSNDSTNNSEKSHADECKWCQEKPDHNHNDDCKYCRQSEQDTYDQDHNHTDNCQWCAKDDVSAGHEHTDNCQWCEAKQNLNIHEHTDDCEYCAMAEQNATEDHDHTDDCKYCAAKQNEENLKQMAPPSNNQEGFSEAMNTDDTKLPLSNKMDDGISRPENYGDQGDENGPDFSDVLQGGLEKHAENINREKIIGMVSQALDGFKANKEILEQAKEHAPELYSSTIAMLKAMIEMAKQLGIGNSDNSDEEMKQPDLIPTTLAPQGESNLTPQR